MEHRNIRIAEADEIQDCCRARHPCEDKQPALLARQRKKIEHIHVPASIQQTINELKEDGLTIVLVADEQQILGMFGLSDQIREGKQSSD